MSKPAYIELPFEERLPILYEDRSVLAIDKPAGWMLVPFSWQKTTRNLQAAVASSIAARDFWARSRGLKFLRYIHRLDADTTGILLFGKSPGAVKAIGDLFETRKMDKLYLAVVKGVPRQPQWTCSLKLGPDPSAKGKMRVDPRHGKEAETRFRILQTANGTTLLEARPLTGRTHQIRVHLASAGHPVLNDELYGTTGERGPGLGLRAVRLGYTDPFTRRRVDISASIEEFMSGFGFEVKPVLAEKQKENLDR